MELYTSSFKTSAGAVSVTATAKGLYALDFGKVKSGSSGKGIPPKVRFLLKKTESFLKDYFSGRRVKFSALPIDWSGYHPFAKQVLCQLRRIPSGTTQTYQFLAQKAGKPKAMRYVGKIVGSNRTPVIIPCHRILPKAGGLGGFSAGIPWKKRLLKLERASVDTMSQVQTGRLARHGMSVIIRPATTIKTRGSTWKHTA